MVMFANNKLNLFLCKRSDSRFNDIQSIHKKGCDSEGNVVCFLV